MLYISTVEKGSQLSGTLKRTVDLINLLFSLMIPYICLFLNCGRIPDFIIIVSSHLRSGLCALFCVYTVGKGKHTEAEGTHFFVFFFYMQNLPLD